MNQLISLNDSTLKLVCRPWWQVWAAMHWGFRKHACVLWCCAGRVPVDLAYEALGIDSVLPVDIVVFYRELVISLTPEKELAQLIVNAMPEPERRHMKSFYAGRQAFESVRERQSVARLINEVFTRNHLRNLRESDDSPEGRIADNRNFAEGIRLTNVMRSGEIQTTPSRVPLILVSEGCVELAETIPALESDWDKNPEDIKIIGDEKDSIWEAARMCFRECPTVIGGVPARVRRQQFIAKGITPQQMFMNALEYDRKNKQPQRIIKRR